MNSLPRKNYALDRVSHLTKSSHAIAIQAITANLSRIRHSYSTVSSIDLQSLNLVKFFNDLSQFDGSCTTEIKSFGSWHFLHLTWRLFKREQLLHRTDQLHSSSLVWLSHSPALSTRTCLLSRFLLSLSTIF